MCPENLRIQHVGKEGFPTLAYDVSCDHAGIAFHVTPGTYGSCNDKTIIRFDRHVHVVRYICSFSSLPSRIVNNYFIILAHVQVEFLVHGS